MNILVIGNGFDLAHGLPTGYKDFLRFTDVFAELNTERRVPGKVVPTKEDKKEQQLFEYVTALLSKAETNSEAKKIVDEIESLITDNQWIEHFKNINIAQGWIDFEREIAQVIQVLDEVRIQTRESLRKHLMSTEMTPYQLIVLKPFIGEISFFTSMEIFDILKDKLLKDLNRLTRCLEIYLCDYVEKLPIKKKLPDIEKLDIDAVVSFNYTNTYRRNYDTKLSKKVEYDFIHGKAKIRNSIETCNMVIGIDEYLKGTMKEEDNEYIQFKKFFQRIYKGTGCKYLDWLEDAKRFPRLNIYIYGHSLDDTDKDILSTLIMADYAKTTIFYHSKSALEKQIMNLTKVITEDELIRRTGGKDRSIRFCQITNEK